MKYSTQVANSRMDLLLASFPETTNPFSEIRRSSGLTMVEFAKKCNISKQALIKLEQGQFVQPLESVMFYVVNELGYSFLATREAYYDYILDTRQASGRFLELGRLDGLSHPLRQARHFDTPQPLSLNFVAKRLCLSQASLEHWERKWRRQQSVPKAFLEALTDAGYLRDDLRLLETAYSDFRKNNLRVSKR